MVQSLTQRKVENYMFTELLTDMNWKPEELQKKQTGGCLLKPDEHFNT